MSGSRLEQLERRLDEVQGDIDLVRELEKVTALASLQRLAAELERDITVERTKAEDADPLQELGDDELFADLLETLVPELSEPELVRLADAVAARLGRPSLTVLEGVGG